MVLLQRRLPRPISKLIGLSLCQSSKGACTCVRQHVRPTHAPKPALDIKHITRNPGLYEQNCLDRNYKAQAQNSWEILRLSQERTKLQNQVRSKREENNQIQAKIKSVSDKSVGESLTKEDIQSKRQELISKAKQLKDELAEASERENGIEESIEQLALVLPNLSSTSTPNGEEPEVIDIVEGTSTANDSNLSHVEIGVELDILDFSSAATTTGWGWYYLKNEAALLEQALIQYTLCMLLSRGWQVVSPPSLVYSHIAAACGFQPRDQNDEQQIYHIQQTEKDLRKPMLSLAATAEIPLASMKAGQTISASQLPLKVVAASRCFRAEAGARGVDTKGLYRVHEFTKVEMFAWTMPNSTGEEHFAKTDMPHSEQIFNDMVEVQKEILSALGLSFRVLEMPSADLGATATRKQDIEAFFPSRRDINDGWGEVTSTSNCTDYQSRRLATRVKLDSGQYDWPYTINGTALAIPRVLAAILETHWNPTDRSVSIPKVLHPWMAGMTAIRKR